MPQPHVYRFPALSNTAVAALQNVAAPGNLILNGSMASFGNDLPSKVVFDGYSRAISLTSANNLSGSNFTITGTYRGQPQVEVIVGPNANTVQSTKLFDSVTQVSVNGAVLAVSVGTGIVGETHWFSSDYYCSVVGMTVQVVVTGAITYSFQTTLDDVNTTSSPTVFNTILDMTNATTTKIMPHATININAGASPSFVIMPTRFSNIRVTAGTGSLVATFLQQGVR